MTLQTFLLETLEEIYSDLDKLEAKNSLSTMDIDGFDQMKTMRDFISKQVERILYLQAHLPQLSVMDLSKITLTLNDFSYFDANGVPIDLYDSMDRLKSLETAKYCLNLLAIFKENPEVATLKLISEKVEEYDDNRYFDDVRLIDLQLSDKSGSAIKIYSLNNDKFSTDLDFDDEEEINGQIVYAWNRDDGVLEGDRWSLLEPLRHLGTLVISLNRVHIESFLTGPIDFDVFNQLLMPSFYKSK